jgi:hypothetical protein
MLKPTIADELTLLRANAWQWVLLGDEKLEPPANCRLTFSTAASLALEIERSVTGCDTLHICW